MMYSIRPTTKFQKDLKRVQRRGYDLSLLKAVIQKLADGEPLPAKSHGFPTKRLILFRRADIIKPGVLE